MYLKASQLMPGCHLPPLYIGMEYSLTNNHPFAEKFLKLARKIAPNDPFVLHELGVTAFNNQVDRSVLPLQGIREKYTNFIDNKQKQLPYKYSKELSDHQQQKSQYFVQIPTQYTVLMSSDKEGPRPSSFSRNHNISSRF